MEEASGASARPLEAVHREVLVEGPCHNICKKALNHNFAATADLGHALHCSQLIRQGYLHTGNLESRTTWGGRETTAHTILF